MQSQDTSNAWAQANSKASAMNTYNADSKAEKKQKRKALIILILTDCLIMSRLITTILLFTKKMKLH